MLDDGRNTSLSVDFAGWFYRLNPMVRADRTAKTALYIRRYRRDWVSGFDVIVEYISENYAGKSKTATSTFCLCAVMKRRRPLFE